MIPSLNGIAVHQSGLFTTAQALTAGVSDAEIKRLVASGAWVRVRRSVYVDAERWAAADAVERHVLSATSIQLVSSRPVVASHWTAALIHRLPMIRPLPDLPQVTANREHFRAVPGARLFNGALHPGHVVELSGLQVTSLARTVSDVARTRAFDDALVMIEHALREGLMVEGDLKRVIADGPTWRGIAWTKRALQYAEPRNESPGETLSMLRMREQGFELPECQVEVVVEGQRYRLDFVWMDRGVVGEFDGRVKYGTHQDVYAEKRREDALRRGGLVVARWGWGDVQGKGEPMARILRTAFAQAAGAPPVPWQQFLAA
jgi:hypothetical protein